MNCPRPATFGLVCLVTVLTALWGSVGSTQPPGFKPRTKEQILADIDRKEKAKAEAMKGLTVRFPYSQVWIPKGGQSIEFGICTLLFDGKEPTQGFFKVGDKTCEVTVESTDREVAGAVKDPKHINGPYYFIFKKPGKATLTVRVGDYSASHDVEVKEAAVAPGDDTDAVIRELGLPSFKQNVFVKWPKTETHDCFIYIPKAGDPFNGEHWWFENHPDLVLSVEDGKVVKLGTNRKRTDNQKEFRILEPNAK
jgi:hypothetical protein